MNWRKVTPICGMDVAVVMEVPIAVTKYRFGRLMSNDGAGERAPQCRPEGFLLQ